MLNYLILGGAGFIGSNLCERLLRSSQHNNVMVFDDFSTGRLENIQQLRDEYPTRFSVAMHNVIHSFFHIRMGKFKPDVIFNLACPASPISYQKNPIE